MIFLRALLSDQQGVPDESALAFLMALLTLMAGAFLRAWGHPFPLSEFAAAVCALVPLYKAARGDWRKSSH